MITTEQTDENDIIIMFEWQEKRGMNYIENNWGIEQRPCWQDTSNVFHPWQGRWWWSIFCEIDFI